MVLSEPESGRASALYSLLDEWEQKPTSCGYLMGTIELNGFGVISKKLLAGCFHFHLLSNNYKHEIY